MNLAFFIARRTAQRTPENKPGVMERIAVISVALSVAVMLLAMAVIMGFKQEVSRKVAAFSGHAVVNGVRGVGTLDSDPVRRSARAEELIRTTEIKECDWSSDVCSSDLKDSCRWPPMPSRAVSSVRRMPCRG